MHNFTVKPPPITEDPDTQPPASDADTKPLKDSLTDNLQSGNQVAAAPSPNTPDTPDDALIKAYRTLRKDEDAVAAHQNSAIKPVEDAAERETAEAEADQQHATIDAIAHDNSSGLFKKKRAERDTKTATRLGLFDDQAAPRLTAAGVGALGDANPGDRAVILARVDAWANRRMFQEGQPVTELAVKAITSDLTARFLTGRALQAWLMRLGTYWAHFQVDRLPRKERKALKQQDADAHDTYRADRKLTRRGRFDDSGAGEALHKLQNAFRAKDKKQDAGPSVDTIATLSGMGSAADRLERPILRQVAGAQSREAPVLVGSGIDSVKTVDSATTAISPALLDIGLSTLPSVDAAPVPADVAQGADEVVQSDNVAAATEAPTDLEPSQYVTAAFPGLIELTLGIHAEASHTSARLRDVRLGDRVGITTETQTIDGRLWVQALIEIPEEPDRLGWLDAGFTDFSDQETSEVPKADAAPAGLTVKGWLRALDPQAALPCFMGVYDEQTRTPITTVAGGSDWRTLLAVHPMTGDTDPDFHEMLVDGRPRYAPRNKLREATQEERWVHEDQLTAKQIGQVRQFAVTQPEHLRAAFFERLAQLPAEHAAAESTAARKDAHSTLSTLAGAFELLGFPQPYVQAKSYADALELVRLELGIEAIVDSSQVASLVTAFGVGNDTVDTGEAMPALRSGNAVVAWHDGALIRLVGQEGTTLRIEDAKGRRDVPSADFEQTCWLALQLAADVDAGTAERTRVAIDGDEVMEAYKTSVYAISSDAEQDWYLAQSASVHAAQSKDLKSWLPSGADAAAMPDAAQDKALRDWNKRNGTGTIAAIVKTKTQFVDPLKAAGGSRATAMETTLKAMARVVLDGHMHHAPGDDAHSNAIAAIALATESGLIDATLSAKYTTWAEDLVPVPTGPTASDFDQLFQNSASKQATPGAVNSVTVAGALTLTDKSGAATDGTGNASASREVSGAWGNVENTVNASNWNTKANDKNGKKQSYKMRGWATQTNQTKIDGDKLDQGTLDEGSLMALGMDPTSARIAQVRSLMEPGSPINAYDGQYVSMAFNQLTFTDSGNGSNAMEMIGRVLYSSGTTIRPECQDLVDALGSQGMTVVEMGKGYSFSLIDPDLGTIGASDGWTRSDLQTLHKAGRFIFPEGQTVEQAMDANEAVLAGKVKDGVHLNNRAELALRYDPGKLIALSAIFADPRMQAGAGINYKVEYIDRAAQINVLGNRLVDYPINEKVLGFATKLANSAPASANALVPQTFFRAAALDDAILDPTGWSGKEALFNERLLMVISGRGLSGTAPASMDPKKAAAAKAAWSGAAGATKIGGTAISTLPIDDDNQQLLGGLHNEDSSTFSGSVKGFFSDAGLLSDGKPRSWTNKETRYNNELRHELSSRASQAWQDEQRAAMKAGGTWTSSISDKPLFGSPMSKYGFDEATQSVIAGLATANADFFNRMVEQALIFSTAPRTADKWSAASTKKRQSYNTSLRSKLNNGGVTAGYDRQQGRAQDWLDVAREAEAQGVVFADKVQWTKGGSFDKVGDIQGALDAPEASASVGPKVNKAPVSMPMNTLIALGHDLEQPDTAALVEAVYKSDAGRLALGTYLAPIAKELALLAIEDGLDLGAMVDGKGFAETLLVFGAQALRYERRDLLDQLGLATQVAIAVGQRYPDLVSSAGHAASHGSDDTHDDHPASYTANNNTGSNIDAIVAANAASKVGDFDPSAVADPKAFLSVTPDNYIQGKEGHRGKGESTNTMDLYGHKGTDGTLGRTSNGKIIKTDFKSDEEYYAALDAFYGTRDGKAATARTDKQKDLLEIARKAARDDGFFLQVRNNSPKAQAATLDLSGAMSKNEHFTFHPELRKRAERFHIFNVAVGLYSKSHLAIGEDGALRSQLVAHRWAVEHVVAKSSSGKKNIWKKVLAGAKAGTHIKGADIVDAHGFVWGHTKHFVNAEGETVSPNDPTLDEAKSKSGIISYIDSLNLRSNKKKSAAEGWADDEVKRWPNEKKGWPYRSPHIVGDAIDWNSHAFINRDDAIIDYVAMEFGLVRRAGGEQWHFERTGRPVGEAPMNED